MCRPGWGSALRLFSAQASQPVHSLLTEAPEEVGASRSRTSLFPVLRHLRRSPGGRHAPQRPRPAGHQSHGDPQAIYSPRPAEGPKARPSCQRDVLNITHGHDCQFRAHRTICLQCAECTNITSNSQILLPQINRLPLTLVKDFGIFWISN